MFQDFSMPGKITTLVVEHFSGETKKVVDVRFNDEGCTISLHNSETQVKEDEISLDHTQISIVKACLQASAPSF